MTHDETPARPQEVLAARRTPRGEGRPEQHMEQEHQSDGLGDPGDRHAQALMDMDVPIWDARRYLLPSEYELFQRTLVPAADAYIAGGEGCLFGDVRLDQRMIAYSIWTDVIKLRKSGEASRRLAQLECDRYVDDLNTALWRFQRQLRMENKPRFTCPPALASYRPGSWCILKLPAQEEVTRWAHPHVERKVPPEFADVIAWDVLTEVLALPSATYEVRGVPSLVWHFTIQLLAIVAMRLAGTTVTRPLRGYHLRMSVGDQELGTYYIGPASWNRQTGFITPISLLVLLAQGALEGDGIELIRQDSRSLIYGVANCDEKVVISRDFRRFIMDAARDRTLPAGLLAVGVIDKLTAQIVEKKMADQSPPQPGAASAGGPADGNAEVESALAKMGYSQADIKAMIERVHPAPGICVADRIRMVLEATQQ